MEKKHILEGTQFFVRFPMLAWLIVPFLGVFLAVNYLIGVTSQPQWVNQSSFLVSSNEEEQVARSFQWEGEGLVTFWFDDAWESQYSVGLPILESKNFPAALAVPTHLVGAEAYMSWAQVRRVQHKGWEITSHTRNHSCDEHALTPEIVESELKGAKEDLDSQGVGSDHFVTPCGIQASIVKEVAKKYYLSFRTTEFGVNVLPLTDMYTITANSLEVNTSVDEVKEWIKEAEEKRGWLILVFHQIDESNSQYSISPFTLQEIVEAVSASKIQVVVPTEAMKVAPGATSIGKKL